MQSGVRATQVSTLLNWHARLGRTKLSLIFTAAVLLPEWAVFVFQPLWISDKFSCRCTEFMNDTLWSFLDSYHLYVSWQIEYVSSHVYRRVVGERRCLYHPSLSTMGTDVHLEFCIVVLISRSCHFHSGVAYKKVHSEHTKGSDYFCARWRWKRARSGNG